MVSFGKRSMQPEKGGGGKENRSLILHNDEVNTFDHVIDVLCDVCEHDAIQAEQCALITHYKGSCHIKNGTVEELLYIQEQLMNQQLLVSID